MLLAHLLHVVALPTLLLSDLPQDSTRALPLAPTRTIRFTTDEGTWMSLDVSPDGRTIVFDLLGDLYTLPITGGRASRITRGMAFDGQPRFSPDGRRIVFTSDRDGWTNLWTTDRDGRNPRQITRYRFWWGARGGVTDRVFSPIWTPDGTAILAVERTEVVGALAPQRIMRYDLATDAAIAVTPHATAGKQRFAGPAFGRDPRLLYAAVDEGSSLGPLFRLVKIDRATGSVRRETGRGDGFAAMRPVLSPDGRYLVYGAPSGDGTGLRLRDLRTDEERWLVRAGQRDLAASLNDSRDVLPGSAFTPDSRFLVAGFRGKIWRIEVPTGSRTLIPFRAEVEQHLGPLLHFPRQVSDRDSLVSIRRLRQPAVSPDGTRAVFVALDRLWLAELPVGSVADGAVPTVVPRRLTAGKDGEFFPTWSPDGRTIVYSTWSEAAGGALYRISTDGCQGRPERLTTDTGAVFAMPAFTPDGERLVAVRAPKRLFHARTDEASGLWAIDPARMPDVEIVTIQASGGAAVPIGRLPAPPSSEIRRLLYAGRLQALADGLGGVDIIAYAATNGLISWPLTPPRSPSDLEGRGADTVTLLRLQQDSTGASVSEALVSPDRRHLLIQKSETSTAGWVYLATAPDTLAGQAVTLVPGAPLPAGMRVTRLDPSGSTAVGWTASGRPYYGIGNALFLAEAPLTALAETPPRFRRIDIDLRVLRARPRGALLFRGARLITMRGREVIERGDLLVRDGRIAALGPRGMVAIPPEARVIDARGMTLLPGYVDAHNHIWAHVHWGMHAPQEWRLTADLAFGVTALREPSGRSSDLTAITQRELIGELLAPRVYSADGPLSSSPELGDGSTHTVERMREILRHWADYLDNDQIKQYQALGRRSRQLLAMAARELRLGVTTEGGGNTAMNLTLALDGFANFEHRMPATPINEDVVQLLVRSGTINTGTLGSGGGFAYMLRHVQIWQDPKLRRFVPPRVLEALEKNYAAAGARDRAFYAEAAAQLAKIMAAGGCVAMGSHGEIPGYGPHLELWAHALGGMPAHDILRMATACSARALGREADFGTLEIGKLADLQVLDANPLEDIHNTVKIRYVMKNGVLWKAATMDQLWPRSESFQGFYWTRD